MRPHKISKLKIRSKSATCLNSKPKAKAGYFRRPLYRKTECYSIPPSSRAPNPLRSPAPNPGRPKTPEGLFCPRTASLQNGLSAVRRCAYDEFQIRLHAAKKRLRPPPHRRRRPKCTCTFMAAKSSAAIRSSHLLLWAPPDSLISNNEMVIIESGCAPLWI